MRGSSDKTVIPVRRYGSSPCFINGEGRWGYFAPPSLPTVRRGEEFPRFRGNDLLFGTILFLFTLSPLHAALFPGAGATGSTFLKIPIGARATAMGSAFTAVSGDVTALEYNPAGLCEMDQVDLTATLINYIQDTKLQSFSAGFPVNFSKGQQYLGEGLMGPDSRKLFLGFNYRSFTGNDIARSETDTGIVSESSQFDIKDQLFQIGLGYSPFERLQMGLSGKYISDKLDTVTMTNYALDAGLMWKLTGQIQAGVSILNLGPQKAFISAADPLPTTLRTGLSFQTRNFLCTADALTGRDKITQEALGVEWKPVSILRIRGGFVNDTNPEFTAGMGLSFSPSLNSMTPADKERRANKNILDELNVPKENPVYQKYSDSNNNSVEFGLDYAFRSNSDLGLSHFFTLKILY